MLHAAYIINNPLKPRDKFTLQKVQHTTLQVLDTELIYVICMAPWANSNYTYVPTQC
jgi:hypothetical protein